MKTQPAHSPSWQQKLLGYPADRQDRNKSPQLGSYFRHRMKYIRAIGQLAIDFVCYNRQTILSRKLEELAHVILGEDGTRWIGWVVDYQGGDIGV